MLVTSGSNPLHFQRLLRITNNVHNVPVRSLDIFNKAPVGVGGTWVSLQLARGLLGLSSLVAELND